MDKIEQVKLLRDGVDNWNDWRRDNNLLFPDLSEENLEHVDLREANLTRTKLQGAYLHKVSLQKANLEDANLENACLVEANLHEASLKNAKLQKADLAYANLQESDFSGANIRESNLSGADLDGAILFKTNLENSDLSNATNYRFDVTKIRNVYYSNVPNDPWSILKQKYTGAAMIWTIAALIAATIPLVAKALYWSALNVYQANQEGVVFTNTTHDQYSVFSLVLGFDRDFYYWVIPTILVIYNILRGFLTWRVAPIRDLEESSGYTPAWTGTSTTSKLWMFHGYRPLYWMHLVVKCIAFLALVVFVVNTFIWLSQDVWMPKGVK